MTGYTGAEADPLGLFLIQAAQKFARDPAALYAESFTGEQHRALTAASGAHKAAHAPRRPELPDPPKNPATRRPANNAAWLRARAEAKKTELNRKGQN